MIFAVLAALSLPASADVVVHLTDAEGTVATLFIDGIELREATGDREEPGVLLSLSSLPRDAAIYMTTWTPGLQLSVEGLRVRTLSAEEMRSRLADGEGRGVSIALAPGLLTTADALKVQIDHNHRGADTLKVEIDHNHREGGEALAGRYGNAWRSGHWEEAGRYGNAW
jgi:hypothetical protein